MREKETHQQLWCPEVHALMKIQHQQQGNSHTNHQELNQIMTNQINTPRFLPNTLMHSCTCMCQSDLLHYCIVVLHLHICNKIDNHPGGRGRLHTLPHRTDESDVLTNRDLLSGLSPLWSAWKNIRSDYHNNCYTIICYWLDTVLSLIHIFKYKVKNVIFFHLCVR